MPTYEYVCNACEHSFDEFQSMKDEPLKKCPACGKKKLRRLIGGGAAILFKGSGFYQTDYRSESYKQSAKKDQASSSSASTSENGSSSASTSTNGKAESSASQSSSENKAKTGKSSKSES